MTDEVPPKLKQNCGLVLKILDDYINSLSAVQMMVADQIENVARVKAKAAESSDPKTDHAREAESQAFINTLNVLRLELSEEKKAAYKHVLKCYYFWKDQVFKFIQEYGISSFQRLNYVVYDIPAKLASLFFINGDYYKAIACLQQAIEIYPQRIEPRAILLKWLIYLSEWEMLEAAIAKEAKLVKKGCDKLLKDQDKDRLKEIIEIGTLFMEYQRNINTRAKVASKLNCMLNECDKKEQTYMAAERYALLEYVNSFLIKVPKPPNAACDPLIALQSSFVKHETVLKNRVIDVLKDDKRINMITVFTNASYALEACSAIAESLDTLREVCLEMYNVGMVREAFQYGLTCLKFGEKFASMFRVQQSLNVLLLAISDISLKEFLIFKPTIVKMAKTVYMSQTTCFTPIMNCLPSPSRVLGTPSRGNKSVASRLLEEFGNLSVSEKRTNTPTREKENARTGLHKISDKCGCETCTLHKQNYNFTMEYSVGDFLVETIDDPCDAAMGALADLFNIIRQTVMKEQVHCLKKNVRPRPPIQMCESFCLAAVKYLRNLEQHEKHYLTNEATRACRTRIIEAGIKVSSYCQIRCIGQLLTFRHFQRISQIPTLISGCRWMGPVKVDPKSTSNGDFLKNTETKGKGNEADHLVFAESPALKKAQDSALLDYNNYKHLLYRHWRFPVTTFLASYSTDSYLAALMWSESILTTCRARSRSITRALEGFCFPGPEIFKAALELMPPDFTLIQFAVDAENNLFMIKINKDKEPIIIPVAHHTKVARVQAKMNYILEKNDLSCDPKKQKASSADERAKDFWVVRRRVEEMLKTAIIGIEQFLFHGFAPLLAPTKSLTPKGLRIVEFFMTSLKKVKGFSMSMAIEMVSILSDVDLKQWHQFCVELGELYGFKNETTASLIKTYPSLRKSIDAGGYFNKQELLYTFIITPSILGVFPFEMMPTYTNYPHVARVASIHSFFFLLRKHPNLPRPVKASNAFYVLDPENNLDKTKARMTEYIGKQTWEGTVGRAPSPVELKQVLAEKDIFFFFGHGSGSKFFNKRTVQESECNAMAVLMGCGSLALDYEGWGLDGKSTVHNYTIAKCPSMLGCLWTVTDGEIDKYFVSLVDALFAENVNLTLDDSQGAPRLRVLLGAMLKARKEVKLLYLTGGAVVTYGLPIVSAE